MGVNSSSLQQYQMQQQSKKKYLVIIAAMEKGYSQGRNSQELHQIFKTCLTKEFKMDLTSDSAMEEVLKEYFKKCQLNFVGTQTYCKKLSFIEKLNSLLYGIGFISRREYLRLKDALSKERDSPTNQWLENMAYLRSSDSREEFRYEFLTRYCNWSDADANELLQDGGSKLTEDMRKAYNTFFRGCLEQELSDMKAVSFIEDNFSNFERKAEMLSPELIRHLDKRLGREVGGSEQELSLNKALMELAQENAYANDQVVKQRLQDEVRMIQKALQKFSGLNIIKSKGLQLRLGKFGSLVSGFAGVDADLDLTILTNCYVNQSEFLKLMYEFLRKECKQQDRNGPRRVYVDLIGTAKTPLINLKVVERGRVDLKIDIIVNNLLGVINSKFLQVYSQVRWIRTLGLLVKMWGKAKMVIDKNMLSSYAIVLMLIHYLIKAKRARPILDHRITNNKAYFEYKRKKLADVEKFKVYYEFRDDPKDVSMEERANYYALLCGFMKYYAEDFWREDEKYRIVTVDQSIDRPVDAECALTIKDPFDEPHNPGRIKLDSKEYLISKFKEAHELLKSGKEDKVRSLFV